MKIPIKELELKIGRRRFCRTCDKTLRYSDKEDRSRDRCRTCLAKDEVEELQARCVNIKYVNDERFKNHPHKFTIETTKSAKEVLLDFIEEAGDNLSDKTKYISIEIKEKE